MAEVGEQTRPRLGRRRDHSRDAEIQEAALDVLAEIGYEGMTIDMVAARARAGKGTVYRRWASKSELVLDAIACMKNTDVDLASPPDTGTLRGDLIAMVKSPTVKESERKIKVMAGVFSMIARDAEFAEAARLALVEPRARANRIIFRRAIERGEIPADSDVEQLITIGAALMHYRVLMLRKPADRDFAISMIDSVILPAARVRAPDEVIADTVRHTE